MPTPHKTHLPAAGGILRKPRAQSKLGGLPEEQKEQIFTWLAVENLHYREVAQKVEEAFGIKISTSGLNGFWNQYCAPRLLKSAPIQPVKPLCEILIQLLPENTLKVRVLPGFRGRRVKC